VHSHKRESRDKPRHEISLLRVGESKRNTCSAWLVNQTRELAADPERMPSKNLKQCLTRACALAADLKDEQQFLRHAVAHLNGTLCCPTMSDASTRLRLPQIVSKNDDFGVHL